MLNKVDTGLFGCDPELFLKREDGSIVGSEKIIPQNGLTDGLSKVIRDGVQVELNPYPAPSPIGLAHNISTCFKLLQPHLKDVKASWDGLVEVNREELDSLSPGSRELGCQPSDNVYGEKPITVDTKLYRKRSAGGHPHFGITPGSKLFSERRQIVPLMDIFLGNTMVLIDRDPGAAERRENYGRAGEFRLQPYGLEYRTLSNCWLKGYALADLVFGMGSAAVNVILQGFIKANDIEPELIGIVKIEKFIEAIDTNNWDLAMENFQSIKPFIVKHFTVGKFPLDASNIDRFEVFVRGVKDKGLDYFFPVDPVESWTNGYYKPFSQVLQEVY